MLTNTKKEGIILWYEFKAKYGIKHIYLLTRGGNRDGTTKKKMVKS